MSSVCNIYRGTRRVLQQQIPSSSCLLSRGNTPKPKRASSSSSTANKNPSHASPSSSTPEGITASTLETTSSITPPPTKRQLVMHALQSSIPMIGFGFMDNTIMIHAGHYVDCTLGVTFGLSTLAAAGIGQIFSGVGGVAFGEMLENAFRQSAVRFGGVSTTMKMTPAQRGMRSSRIASLTGGILGVTLGCTLGLVNLLFVDEWRKESLTLQKLRALQEGQEFEFEVEVNNDMHPGYTTVVVRGPDVDGVLASITASLASIGCSVMELHAARRGGEQRRSTNDESEGETTDDDGKDDNRDMHSLPQLSSASLSPHQQTINKIEDIFLIHDRSTHRPIENDDLDFLAKTVLSAAKDPLNSHSLRAQVDELQLENYMLADRIAMLENLVEERQIKVVPSTSSSSSDAVASASEKL
jgi:hypothetical protein